MYTYLHTFPHNTDSCNACQFEFHYKLYYTVTDDFPSVVEGHEVSSVAEAAVGLCVQFCGLLDVFEVADHQDHSQHANAACHNTLQQNLARKIANLELKIVRWRSFDLSTYITRETGILLFC